jgi:Arc-like DNA binding domain
MNCLIRYLESPAMNRADAQKTTLRMRSEVVEWVKKRATHNVSSVTTEFVRVVRDRMAEEGRAEKATV